MSVWGIVPAAGNGTRIQPLAFSKELLPVGSRIDETGAERPRAVSEYVVERMAAAGVEKICVVISAGKSDIMQYYGGAIGTAPVAYVIQDRADGLCDAIFRARPLIGADDVVVVGLPDTVWFPVDALACLADGRFSFLLFPVERPELFDAVETDRDGRVTAVRVKSGEASSGWIWGAFKMPGRVLHALHALWVERDRADLFVGSLVQAWLASGGEAWGVRAGARYVDVGTLHGYRQALQLLAEVAPVPDGRAPAGTILRGDR